MRTKDQEGRTLAFEFSSKTFIANDAISRFAITSISHRLQCFEMAWTALIQRFENTIQPTISRPRNADERGMIFPDRTDDYLATSEFVV
jgi:hypothetical protein